MTDGPTVALVGRRFGDYRVLDLIGAGGMGEVYRARDEVLDRDVAIKVLPPAFLTRADRRTRFEREARALAALNHPNIGAIYGVVDIDGARGLVLELVEGPTLADIIASAPRPPKSSTRTSGSAAPLRGGLSIEQSLEYGRQMAHALEAAHEKGIVHRDLKPSNIKVTPQGVVKVLDFGLAKIGHPQDVDPEAPTVSVDRTGPGAVLGTAAYMSPEQARGETVDSRSDVWAFGCVLFEMLAGRRPFPGRTSLDVIAAILEREPDWPALPAATPAPVRRLLERCLDKNPGQRFHHVADARLEIDRALAGPFAEATALPRRTLVAVAALTVLLVVALATWQRHAIGRWLSGTAPASTSPSAAEAAAPGLIRSIAILPFRNLNKAPAYDYFGLGLAAVLSGKLTNARVLEVRAPRAPWTLMNVDVDLAQIANELGVDAVLAGTYEIDGKDLSLTYELTDVKRRVLITGDSIYDAFTNVIAVEHRLAQHIVDSLKLSAGGADTRRLTMSGTQQNEAFQAYLRSRYEMELFWKEPSAAQLATVERYLTQALKSDPRFPQALISLSTLHWISAFWGYSTDAGVLDRAGTNAALAIQIDPDNGEGYAARALVQFQRGRLNDVRESLRQAFARSPNSGLAYYAAGFYYMGRGLPDDSVRAFTRARELDPDRVRRELGLAYRYAADFDHAAQQLQQDLDAHPGDVVTAINLAWILSAKGNVAAARAIQKDRIPNTPADPNVQGLAALLDTIEHRPFPLSSWIARFRDHYWADGGYCANVAGVLAAAGRADEAITWIERAGELSMRNYPFVNGNPLYASLRGQPKFDALVAAFRLEWQREVRREEQDPLMPRSRR